MGTKSIPAGFRQIPSHDGIFQEQVHDAYKAKGKLPEPTVCPQCGAIFSNGRWQWGQAAAGAHQETCPACHRVHDQFPAGFLTLQGDFFLAHRDEIMQLVRSVEKHERANHPLKRIVAIEDKGATALVTTTEIHLARGIGVALHHAYQGELELHYHPGENQLRVNWTR